MVWIWQRLSEQIKILDFFIYIRIFIPIRSNIYLRAMLSANKFSKGNDGNEKEFKDIYKTF